MTGYEQGYIEAEQIGYELGYSEGKDIGYSQGKETSYAEGRAAGYKEGFRDGSRSCWYYYQWCWLDHCPPDDCCNLPYYHT